MTSPLGCWWAAHVRRIQNQTPDLPLRPGRPPTSGNGGSNLGAQAKNCGISPRLPTSDASQNLQNTRGLTFLTWPAGPLPSFTGLPRPQPSRAYPQHPTLCSLPSGPSAHPLLPTPSCRSHVCPFSVPYSPGSHSQRAPARLSHADGFVCWDTSLPLASISTSL